MNLASLFEILEPKSVHHNVVNLLIKPDMGTHTFNSSTLEAEAGGTLSPRPVWSTEGVPGQPWLHSKCDGLYMHGPGSGTTRRCGPVGVGVASLEWFVSLWVWV